MDVSQYKDYVLLFVKYVSDKYAGKPNALIEIPADGGFRDMVELKNQKDIGDGINKIIAKLAEENDLKGVIDQTDFNDDTKLGKGKEMVDKGWTCDLVPKNLVINQYFKEKKEVIEELNKKIEDIARQKEEGDLKKEIKEAEKTLDQKLLSKYGELSEEEIKILVVNDKWMTTIANSVKTELDRITQNLSQRIKELSKRYVDPLPQLEERTRKILSFLCK